MVQSRCARSFSVVVVAAGVLSAEARAVEIYTSGIPDPASNASISDAAITQRMGSIFVPTISGDVDHMRFWGVYTLPAVPPTDDFVITFYVRGPGTGAIDPSDIIVSYNVGNIGRTSTGTFIQGNGLEIFQYDATFAPVAVQAGNAYAVSVFDNETTVLGHFAWKHLPPFQGQNVFSSDGGLTWNTSQAGLAYALFQDGVPVPISGPTTMAILACSLIGGSWWILRRA